MPPGKNVRWQEQDKHLRQEHDKSDEVPRQHCLRGWWIFGVGEVPPVQDEEGECSTEWKDAPFGRHVSPSVRPWWIDYKNW